MLLRVSLAVLLSLSVGCGGDDDDDDDNDDIASVDAAVDAAGDSADAPPGAAIDATPGVPDAAACHALAQTAPVIERAQIAADPPTAVGGTIPDGTYHLIGDDIYTGPGGPSGGTGIERQKTTRELAGSGVETIVSFEDGDERSSFDSTIVGMTISYANTCGPGSDSSAIPYSVIVGETTQWLLIAGQRVETYELQ